MERRRVVVAMSGGVDSSVAAALLKSKGYEVIGITMCFNIERHSGKKPTCCGIENIDDARRVAHKLGIKHYVINMKLPLEKYIIKDFCAEYLRGRTPNPCVRCNQYIKFRILLKKALSLGAVFLATGHYARIQQAPSWEFGDWNYLLKKAKDLKKDQSYFLYRLNQSQLKHIFFPVGHYTKEEVRNLAKEFDLPVAYKLASQEICFLPELDYRKFLRERIKAKNIKPGPIVDKRGNILGKHKGIAFYTIGQREGLGIAKGYPLYISCIDARNNRIAVGRREEVLSKEFLVKDYNFILRPIKKKIAARVRIRYNHKEAAAEIIPAEDILKVSFRKAQFAITPGQSAVFYDKDIVLGGGIIEKVVG